MTAKVKESGVRVRTDDRSVTIAFDRPEKGNALNVEMGLAIQGALSAHEHLELPVVFRSHEPGMFISGSDVGDLRQRSVADSLARTTAVLCQRIADYPWPTIAAVEGYALGGGCEVALACDFRVSAESAQWGFPEVRLGIIPGAGGLTRLPALVGWGNAKDLVLTGRRISAAEAQRLGLVQRVAQAGELDQVLEDLLADLAKGSAFAQRLAKEAMGVDASPRRLVDAAAQALCIASDSAQTRLAALLSSREG